MVSNVLMWQVASIINTLHFLLDDTETMRMDLCQFHFWNRDQQNTSTPNTCEQVNNDNLYHTHTHTHTRVAGPATKMITQFHASDFIRQLPATGLSQLETQRWQKRWREWEQGIRLYFTPKDFSFTISTVSFSSVELSTWELSCGLKENSNASACAFTPTSRGVTHSLFLRGHECVCVCVGGGGSWCDTQQPQ